MSSIFLSILLWIPVIGEASTPTYRAGIVQISSGWLNIRSGPSTASSKVTTVAKGSMLTLISREGQWWKVEYARGRYGYCHANYISEHAATAVTVATQSGALNIRSGPGTGYSKIGTLQKGDTVLQLSQSGGWSRILYHGTKTGYVSNAYLAIQYHAVQNSTPDLKQMDPRWADLPVGESGKTFSQIGCATTAIAMVESRRLGYNVTPDEMADKLRYTPSGSVYWPSYYTPVTSSENYLFRIYQQLKNGKVVLFGAKNSYGTQHWVVITGYSGGQSLTAQGFQVNDPGSNSRKNLQQLLDQYPYFYKYFIY